MCKASSAEQCGTCVADCGASFLSQADRQLRLLEQRPGPSNIIVVGGGYCGIELATTVAERMGGRGRLQLVTGGAVCSSHKQYLLWQYKLQARRLFVSVHLERCCEGAGGSVSAPHVSANSATMTQENHCLGFISGGRDG